jgi:hypothetical protein
MIDILLDDHADGNAGAAVGRSIDELWRLTDIDTRSFPHALSSARRLTTGLAIDQSISSAVARKVRLRFCK